MPQGVLGEHKETRNGNEKKKIRLAAPSSYSTHTHNSAYRFQNTINKSMRDGWGDAHEEVVEVHVLG
jgi:hypothetical protein